jgi:hypothetical protein
MRKYSKIIGLATALCAVALPTTSAFGFTEFTASREPVPVSEASPGKTKGRGIGGERGQTLKVGPFTIKCDLKTSASTVAEGAITWESSPTLETTFKLTRCLAVAKFGTFIAGIRTNFNEGSPATIRYHINGSVDISGFSLKVSGKICKMNIFAQTIPAKEKEPGEPLEYALYSNKEVAVTPSKKFPEGIQKRLVIANQLKKMEWEYEEGQCVGEFGFEEEATKTEGKNAQWEGALEEEMTAGNLGVA